VALSDTLLEPTGKPKTEIRVGPFVLEEPVGRGGMGAVWRGRHLEQRVPVAVKVLDTQITDGELDEAFRNEVRAVARLDHPGVVWVYDIGQIDAAAAASSTGRIGAGCPYIAMELAGRGTLRDWGRLPWEGVREVLLALLDALAHAHARGVIHQDLKPANVLVCGPEDIRPGLKLADFGIAHAIERRELNRTGQRTAIGTVQYMAPEQIRAESWECGPWTDIYSLGNVAWQLLTGQIPFHQYQGVALVRAQLEEMLPDAGIRAPQGFRDWFRRCAAKDPRQRFRRAADAAEALMELPEHADDGPVRANDQLDRLPTIRVPDDHGGDPRTDPLTPDNGISPKTGLPQGVGLETGLVSFQIGSTTRTTGDNSEVITVRRLIDDWRRHDTPRSSLQLLGAGLKLWGVRRSPMVGRIDERDALWGVLQEVVREGRQRAVVITGPAGTGKTRLGSWLAERAHELGVATALRTRFFAGDGDGPLRRMWARHLRMGEVEAGGRGKWLAKTLMRLGIDGAPADFAVLVGPGDPAMRRRRSVEMIEAMTDERPVLVMFDDVHVGFDGLLLAKELLEARARFPVLVVMTARSEALVDHPEEGLLVEQICETAAAVHMPIGPLTQRDHVTLVEEVLGLSPALAAQVVDRTGGNPLFVLELIGDWIKRGVLTLGATGFDVRRGEVAELPDEMRQAWSKRVERMLEGMPDRASSVLERAAALGITVRAREWQLACDDPDAGWISAGRTRVVPEHDRLRTEIVDRLVAGRLAERTESGFRFAHGMIREAVLARASDRLPEHHAACAAILVHAAEHQDSAAERIGWHLLQAGQLEQAIEPLLLGVMHRRDAAGARSALGLLSAAVSALSRLDVPRDDPQWAEAWQLRALLCAELGEIAEAERMAFKVLEREDLPGWVPHALDARLTLARIHASRGELADAETLLERILALSTDPVQQGLAHAERALVAARRKDAVQARGHTDQAVRLLRRAASSRALAECWRLVGTTAMYAENTRQAEDGLARGLRLYQRRGNLIGQAECLAGMGRVALMRGEPELSEDRLRRAIHLYEVAGNSDIVKPKADLARLRIEGGHFDEGRDLLANLRLQLHRQGRHGLEGLGAMQVAAAAGCLDWEEFEHRLRQVEQDPHNEVGQDGRWALDLAVELTAAAGDLARTSRLESLADGLRAGRGA
jgi:eukaryotic-like serine/threonine-protein kinase